MYTECDNFGRLPKCVFFSPVKQTLAVEAGVVAEIIKVIEVIVLIVLEVAVDAAAAAVVPVDAAAVT